LAEGCVRASKKLGKGSEELCVHVKGQELFECLWMSPSWALGVMVSPRGGTHTRGSAIEERLVDVDPKIMMDLFGVSSIGSVSSYENKERLVLFYEKLDAVLDVLGMCTFTNSLRMDMLLPEDYANLASAATGLSIDKNRLLLIGERVHNVEKCFNVLHTNWIRKDDIPPKKFIDVPLAGRYRIKMAEWNKMLDRYYESHGWSKDTGWPTGETLKKLHLPEIADKLKSCKKLL
jgi:aldehyde:ferredoxin oxidoreductase